jgi:hypothetical protein
MADEATGVLSLQRCTDRIFHLQAEGPDLLSVAVRSAGRFIAPGDVVYLQLPSSRMTGHYLILSGATPLRGRGQHIQLRAYRVPYRQETLYAPTVTVGSIDGGELTITEKGHAHRYGSVDRVYIYDPDDYTDGDTYTVESVDDDDHTINVSSYDGSTVGDIAVGDLVEFDPADDHSETVDGYAYTDDSDTWGD